MIKVRITFEGKNIGYSIYRIGMTEKYIDTVDTLKEARKIKREELNG